MALPRHIMRRPPRATALGPAARRNPLLALPAVARLRALDSPARLVIREILLDLQRDARDRADHSWRTRKPPMASYWAAVGVYAGHLARALR
jgi:hypothetical protein